MRGMQSEQIGPQDYLSATLSFGMAGLAAFAKASAAERTLGPARPWRRRDPTIHVFPHSHKNVDARDKPGHDDVEGAAATIRVFRKPPSCRRCRAVRPLCGSA